MSFTSGAILYQESLTVAELFAELEDWGAVRDEVVAQNLLQMRTLNASKRICQEVISRLKLLTPDQLDLLIDGTRQEQLHMLWLAVCKRYRFIYDFAVEVVREQFLRLNYQLTYDHYQTFFLEKAAWHPEVERVAESTRAKQRQIIFKMLREVDILTNDHGIIPAFLSPRTIERIGQDDPRYLAIFPISELDIQEQRS